MMERDYHNFLHKGRKFYQQWIIDQYAKMENSRLQYCFHRQKDFRCDKYQIFFDALQAGEIENIGQMVILPYSFTGSDRWFYNNYRDAMALICKFGKPTFFITFTFDVNCTEVTKELKTGQTTFDHPDIIFWIYEMKKKEFIHVLTVKHVLGIYITHIAVIEFQKRGVPHCHILMWIENF